MNLGQAVAVCLYEIVRSPSVQKGTLARAEEPTPPADAKAADAESLERLTLRLEEVLALSGYVHGEGRGSTSISTTLKIRRLIRRMKLDTHDAEVWLGMLRQIQWKLISYNK
jgi:tRNA/rRNA methyltransferase